MKDSPRLPCLSMYEPDWEKEPYDLLSSISGVVPSSWSANRNCGSSVTEGREKPGDTGCNEADDDVLTREMDTEGVGRTLLGDLCVPVVDNGD